MRKRPDILQEKLNIVSEELKNFFKSVIDYAGRNNVFAIVLFSRRSFYLFKHFNLNQRCRELKVFSENIFLDTINLDSLMKYQSKIKREFIYKDKKILIVDDVINKGDKIKEFLEKLEKAIKVDSKYSEYNSVELFNKTFGKNNIEVCAFITNISDNFYGGKGKEEQEYWGYRKLGLQIIQGKEKLSSEIVLSVVQILNYLASTGDILDCDHLFIEIIFKRSTEKSNLIKELNTLTERDTNFVPYKPNLRFYHPSKEKYSLYLLNNEKYLNNKLLAEMVSKSFQCKIRFLLDLTKDNEVQMMINPIANPKINFKNVGFQKRCKELVQSPLCILNSVPIEIEYKKDKPKEILDIYANICKDCILFEIITRLLKYFYNSLITQTNFNNFTIKSKKCSWDKMSEIYGKEERLDAVCTDFK